MNPSIQIIEKSVPSTDGIHTLAGRVFLPAPDVSPRGFFHVVHGMIEHIGRYEPFMRAMAEDGYICFGYDNLGHGKTARNEQELGYIARKNGWQLLARDVAAFADAMRKEYGDLPYTLMGHSMGSFIVRVAAEQTVTPDRLVVMGTGGPNAASVPGIAAIKTVKFFCGERHVSSFVENLAFSTYNSHFKDEADAKSWLSKDVEARARNAQDPLCNFHFTVSAMQDLIKLNMVANRAAWFRAMAGKCPILLVSGDEDPVGDYGRGVKTVFRKLQAAGADVTLRLYPGYRHEILNDASAPDVIRDIQAFVSGK